MPSTETPTLRPTDNKVIFAHTQSRWHGHDQFYFSQESVPDNAASAGFCHYHQKRDLEESCHFPPLSAFLVMSPVVGSPQGLGLHGDQKQLGRAHVWAGQERGELEPSPAVVLLGQGLIWGPRP